MSGTYSWVGGSGGNSGDWNTGSLWSTGTVPQAGADVTIDLTGITSAYTVTIGNTESITVNTLQLNAPNDGTNQPTYIGAYLQMNGTLAFDSPNSIGGSLQSQVYSDGGTFINAGTVAPFFQGSGTVVFTGTNGIYFQNELQSDGTVIVNTSSIAEMIGNTLTDGIFYANGPDTAIDLGGSLGALGGGFAPDITAIEGPQGQGLTAGWTDLTYLGAGSAINEWNGTAYVPVANTLATIMGGGTVDVENGAVYNTSNALTINNVGSSDGPGLLGLKGGTVIAAGVTLSSGVLQGYGTLEAPLVNNGTIFVEGGALDLTGSITGTGTILFDKDFEHGGSVVPGGATLVAGAVSAGQTLVLNADDTLDLAAPASFAGTIEVVPGAQIVLTGQTITSAVLTGSTLAVTDGTGVVDLAVALEGQGTVAFNASGSVISVAGTITPISLTGIAAVQTIAATGTLDPFSTAVVTDNSGQTDTVTVTLSSAGSGTLASAAGGSFNAATGAYTVSGSATAVTAALDQLVFTPSGTIMPGSTLTTGFNVSVTDTAGGQTAITASLVAVAPAQVINGSDGTSFAVAYNPSTGASEVITQFSGANGTGTKISETVDSTSGTSLLYAYNPISTVSLTATQYSGPNDTGSHVSEVVDDTSGQALVYAYNPTSTTVLTAQLWSATDPTNGAPTGSEISDVVDNANGTSLLYSYNPTSTVTLTVAEYSATNPANGAPTGNEISDVLDKSDGTSVLYAYNPASNVLQTASFYSGTDASTGAPTGTLTLEVIDYTNGESAVTSYDANGNASTLYYSGADGTGTSIPGITASGSMAMAAPTPSVAAPSGNGSDGSVINIATSNQLVDPGAGSFAIQFASGATNDTLMLHAGGVDQVSGFGVAAGDKLDFSALLSAAGVNIGNDMAQLSNYVSVEAVNGSAQILFDPAGHGGGSQVALLLNDANLVPQLQTLKSFTA